MSTSAPGNPVAALPDAGREGVGLVVVGTWRTGSTERQGSAMLAVERALELVGWPSGLLSHTALAGADGTTIVQYSQWLDEAAARRFAAKGAWTAAVAKAAPGIERIGAVPYRVHGQAEGSVSGGRPGCVVLVSFAAEGQQRAAGWIDSMLRLGSVDTASTGLRAATFHLSVDGTRILNYAEWTDEHSHVSAVARQKAPDEDVLVRSTPGVHNLGYQRFLCWNSSAGPESGRG